MEARVLFEKCTLNNLKMSGVPDMARTYLRHIAPLEGLEAKRGYSWRGERFAGRKGANSWKCLLLKMYEPILCRVLEHMDANPHMDFWGACDALETQREALGSNWDALVKTYEVARFAQDTKVRAPYLKRLQSAELTATLGTQVRMETPD